MLQSSTANPLKATQRSLAMLAASIKHGKRNAALRPWKKSASETRRHASGCKAGAVDMKGAKKAAGRDKADLLCRGSRIVLLLYCINLFQYVSYGIQTHLAEVRSTPSPPSRNGKDSVRGRKATRTFFAVGAFTKMRQNARAAN